MPGLPISTGSLNKKCPFLNMFGQAQACIKTDCMFWNAEMKDQKTLDAIPFAEKFGSVLGIGQGRCMILVMAEQANTQATTAQHLHDQHKHNAPHPPSEVKAGPPFGAMDIESLTQIPKAGQLATEFSMSEDLNKDGMKFGKDFGIYNTEDKPIILNSLEQNMAWSTPDVMVTWDDYQNNRWPRQTPVITNITKSYVITDSSTGLERFTNQQEILEKNISKEDVTVLFTVTGKNFTEIGYEYPHDPADDPYPGYPPKSTSVFGTVSSIKEYIESIFSGNVSSQSAGNDIQLTDSNGNPVYDSSTSTFDAGENSSNLVTHISDMSGYNHRKKVWEANRGNKMTWSEFRSNNDLTIKFGDHTMSHYHIMDQRLKRVMFKLNPYDEIEPSLDMTSTSQYKIDITIKDSDNCSYNVSYPTTFTIFDW